jgi:putative spermidine/putrescine transport system permease protein
MSASAATQSRSQLPRSPRIDARSWLVAPAAAVLTIAFIYPVFHFLLRSLSDPVWGLQNFLTLIHQPVYARALWNTVVVSGTVTLFCVVLGYPLAYTIANAGPRVRRLLVFAVLVPFWSSLLVRTFAWMVLLQRNGLINQVLLKLGLIDAPLTLIYNRVGVIIGMVHILLPFMILPLYSVLLRIDPSYTSAAASLGAPPVSSFLRVYLPLSLPGVVTGTMLVFVIGLGYFITPALLGGPGDTMIAQIIAMEVSDFGRWGLAGAVGLVLLLGTSVIFVLVQRSLTTPR